MGMTSSKTKQSVPKSNGMNPLARSASCIDVPKVGSLRTSLNSLQNGLSSEIGGITEHHSNGMEVESSLFLRPNSKSMTSSLIGSHSMIQFRREQMEQSPDQNESMNLDLNQKLNDSPSNNMLIGGLGQTAGTPSVSTHSMQSQDDLVAKDSTFGIHPIMERMAAQKNQSVSSQQIDIRKWFFFYLDQLLSIQCHRITTRSKSDDGNDDIYDVDTVNGSFIWKNELRKHWVRSRIERRKMMEQKPPENPFETAIKFESDKMKLSPNAKIDSNAKDKRIANGLNQKKHSEKGRMQRSESPDDPYLDQMANSALSGGTLLIESQSQSDDAADDWFGMDETVDHDDDSESPD